MNVEQLIMELQKMPPKAEVRVDTDPHGSCCGCDDHSVPELELTEDVMFGTKLGDVVWIKGVAR